MQSPHGAGFAVDVLIAEDDPVARESLRLVLERQGYTCAEASNGREAVEMARRHPPQFVLLDLVLPELDGYAVARTLRSDPSTRAAHIHCLTGVQDPGARERARQAGCEAFLTKPVDPRELLDLVDRQVRQAAAEWLTGLTKEQAEHLLDWLEANGYPSGEVVAGDSGFALRCPGYVVRRTPDGGARFIRASG
jgi:two-component system, cell cycle response regulator DivK